MSVTKQLDISHTTDIIRKCGGQQKASFVVMNWSLEPMVIVPVPVPALSLPLFTACNKQGQKLEKLILCFFYFIMWLYMCLCYVCDLLDINLSSLRTTLGDLFYCRNDISEIMFALLILISIWLFVNYPDYDGLRFWRLISRSEEYVCLVVKYRVFVTTGRV